MGSLDDFLGGPSPPPAWRRGSDTDAWGGGGDRSEPDRRSNRDHAMFGGGSSRGGSRGGMGGGMGGGGEPGTMSELDYLHKLGDQKFGRRRR